MTASWPADDAEAVYSDLEITEAGGNPLYAQTSGARYTWQGVTPGVSYSVRRRRVDRVGNRSNWSPAASHTVARDTVPPAVPTGLKAAAGFNTIWLEWNRNTEADFSHYEVASGKANNPSTVVTRTPATSAVITEVPEGEVRYVRIRAVDTSGNVSAWTASVSKAPVAAPDPTITTEKLKGLVDATPDRLGGVVGGTLDLVADNPHEKTLGFDGQRVRRSGGVTRP